LKNKIIQAYKDLTSSLKKYRLWLYLGWSDIKLRYKGSILGPFWITLSMSIFIITIGAVYSRLLNQPLANYIPYLTSGLLIWNYIASILIDSNDMFHNSKHFISHIRLPYYIYLYRVIWRNTIIFSHNFIVYLFILIYFRVPINWNSLFFIPGFFLLTFTLTFVGLLIGLIGTRFRDIPPVISSVIQIVFFISPIAWMTKILNPNSLILRLNPLTYFLDIVRSPLLGQMPEKISWFVCLGLSFMMVLIVSPLFAINRTRIPFWL
jgi:lipopolysaccharide transport system permease protein